MKSAGVRVAGAGALAGCGSGEHSPAPAGPEPGTPAPPAKAGPGPQPVDRANINPQPGPAAKAVQPIQHEPIMKPKQATEAKIVKTDAEWRAKLTPEEDRIPRQKGTERAVTENGRAHV